jgi:putative salt-induced outer membrane protein YdiY
MLASGGVVAQEASPIATEILALEQALADAVLARDRGTMERLLAPDYVLRSAPDIDRAAWIANSLKLCWGDRWDLDRFSARTQEDTVVASFELTFYVDPGTCRPAVLRSLITDIWIRGPDGWQLLVRHSGPVPQPGAQLTAQFGLAPLAPPTWDVSGELSFVATGGNTSVRTLGLASELTHRSARTATSATVAYVTSESDEETNARAVAARARHGVRVDSRVELFGRGAYARDRFAGIANRWAGDVGAGFVVPMPPAHGLTAEGSVGFTDEQRLDATDRRFATATGALTYVWTIGPGSELKQDVAVIGDLELARNWRGTAITALSVTLSRLLSLKASHGFEYRNVPVAGFGRVDRRTAAALVVTFERRPPPS